MYTRNSLLSKQEQNDLTVVCEHTKLHFHAMAARPKVARELIRDHLADAKRTYDFNQKYRNKRSK